MPETSITPNKKDYTWPMLAHISGFAGFFFPFGGLLGPYIVYSMKKSSDPETTAHAKAAFNLSLTTVLASMAFAAVGFCFYAVSMFIPSIQNNGNERSWEMLKNADSSGSLTLVLLGLGVLLAVLAIVPYFWWLGFSIVNIIRANQGQTARTGPIIRFLK